MLWGSFVIFGLSGVAIILSYTIVLFDLLGWFPLPDTTEKSFLKSPYWLGLPSDSIVGAVILWAMAAVGYVTWFLWVFSDDQRTVIMRPALFVFLFSSIAWPFSAYTMIASPSRSIGRTLVACITLWLAAGGAWWMVAQTFLLRPPVHAMLGVIFLANAVVLVDGIGWTILALSREY